MNNIYFISTVSIFKISKKLLILVLLILPLVSTGQTDSVPENVIYVVDSIPIVKEPPEEMNTLDESVIAQVVVVKNKEELRKLGYEKLDGAIFIFTKEYANRSAEIKAIPTTKTMVRKNGYWYLKGSSVPYTGRFIDY